MATIKARLIQQIDCLTANGQTLTEQLGLVADFMLDQRRMLLNKIVTLQDQKNFLLTLEGDDPEALDAVCKKVTRVVDEIKVLADKASEAQAGEPPLLPLAQIRDVSSAGRVSPAELHMLSSDAEQGQRLADAKVEETDESSTRHLAPTEFPPFVPPDPDEFKHDSNGRA